MAAAPAHDALSTLLKPVTDAESLKLFEPTDDDAVEKDTFINNHPLVLELRANPDFSESRPHMKMPAAYRGQSLTGGTLMGPGKVSVPPLGFTEKGGKSYVQIFHVGTDLCGHVGIIHGGFLATMLDESLARCCFPALPHNIGFTAKLEINYKAPAMANQYLVLKAKTTKVEGRKAWVDGQIETLPTAEGEEPVVLVTASALFVSPKQAAVSCLPIMIHLICVSNS
jgi:adenylylsulfate kinase